MQSPRCIRSVFIVKLSLIPVACSEWPRLSHLIVVIILGNLNGLLMVLSLKLLCISTKYILLTQQA